MRGVNQNLRAVEQVESPPLMDEEIIAQFARDTGKIINSNGEVIGEVPNWKREMGPAPEGPFPPITPSPTRFQPEAQDMFGRKKDNLAGGARAGSRKIRGIDLEAGDVIIDNQRYALNEREVASVAEFALKVMARALDQEITQMAADYGILPAQPPVQEVQGAVSPAVVEDVPPVQAGSVEGQVSEGQDA